jgi:Uma2 family endonuclease
MQIAQHRHQVPSRNIILNNISWQNFEKLLLELGENQGAKLAYDRGRLEIMTPLPEHEYYKEILSLTIQDIAEELDLDYESYGSATWKREKELAGLEADNCFYFQNEDRVRGKLTLDLDQDPPPDLALEIDLTHKSLNRFPIYARLGVPEIWCYDSGALKIYQLQGADYQEVDKSDIFPNLPIQELPRVIERDRLQGRRAIRRAVRAWVKEKS